MLHATDITKTFHADGVPTVALDGVGIAIEAGDFTAIVGPSGSGKTTLLHVLSTLLAPDSGSLVYDGHELADHNTAAIDRLRAKDFAVIFQFHHLLPYMSALENTLLPFMGGLAPVSRERIEHARHCLERVGIADKADRLPSMLSGGEQQRVAIARALVKDSRILFADEPTGSLDSANSAGIMDLLEELNSDGLTIAMVTHDPRNAARARTTVHLVDGRLGTPGGTANAA